MAFEGCGTEQEPPIQTHRSNSVCTSSQVSHPFTVAGKTLCITVPQGVRTKWPGPLESSLSFRKVRASELVCLRPSANVGFISVVDWEKTLNLCVYVGLTKRDLAMADRLNVHHVAVETTDL
uniref:Uncharacterized protein n=1 Tax=Magallana gigas TaxID=29159 RepID=A0A8W8NN00_MAGGI